MTPSLTLLADRGQGCAATLLGSHDSIAGGKSLCAKLPGFHAPVARHMTPLALWPESARAGLRGVLPDIDDTL